MSEDYIRLLVVALTISCRVFW